MAHRVVGTVTPCVEGGATTNQDQGGSFMWYRLQKRMALVALLAVLGAVLAACGGGGTANEGAATSPAAAGGEASPAAAGGEASPAASGAATTEGGQASAACPESAQGQQITMWSPLTGPDGDEMSALAQRFSQENGSGITVQHQPRPEYLQALNTAAAGGNLPQMTVIRASDIAEMAARGVLKPMGEEALSVLGDDIAGEFPEQVWNIGEFRDARYAVPLDVHPLVLYYNKDMFEEAGITVPTDRPMNREEFEAAAEALNKDGVAGIALGNLFQGETLFETLLNQFGGELSNEEGTEATFNSEAGVEALTYLRDLKQKYSPNISGTGDPEVTQFQQGRAAMVIHGPWHISNLSRLPFTGFAQVPQIGDEFAVWGGSHQLGITTEDPAQQAAAACWISWLSENSVQWATAGQVPARESAREGEELASVAAPVAAFADEIESVVMPPSVPGFSTAIGGEGFGRAVNPVLLGQQSDIQAALNEAAERSTQLLQENARSYAE
jgi:multiple sugar transport system substrate-binding protein